MYFAILGKNPEISKAELQLIQPTAISYPKKGVIMFDTKYPDLFSQLGGIIKAGRVVLEKELQTELQDCKIIGIKEDANGKHLKKTIGIRRFKIVDFFHTDKEIKEKGKELINIGNGLYGIVEQYQNIKLYEVIDFDKPSRSMQMGMMPSKLTHIMINIGLNELEVPVDALYDPFVGSGTTAFLANAFGYNFIGSDINIGYMERNLQRWKTTEFYQPEHEIKIFSHDIRLPRKSTNPKEVFGEHIPNLIVTEGWLGPIVKAGISEKEISAIQRETAMFYKDFIIHIHNLFGPQKEKPVIVFTIPIYPGKNYIEAELSKLVQDLKQRKLSSVSEVYKRENQNIGRKILIIR